MLVPVASTVLLSILGLASASCPHEGITLRTSDAASLPNPAQLADNATLQLDFELLVDNATPRLAGIVITNGGRLVFDPAGAGVLYSQYVLIEDGGSLEVGSEDCPFDGEAEIVLIGKQGDMEPLGTNGREGEKGIVVRSGGSLELHGTPKRAWTNIEGTLEPGLGADGAEYSITLADPVTWEAGDLIVIASTDFDWKQAETVEVVSCDGTTCQVKGQLQYRHFGAIDRGVDMRAEVGVLNRNVVVRGELEDECYMQVHCDLADRDMFGGHILVLQGFASFRVENVELTAMGQQGVMARYPLHWHMAGHIVPGENSYVRSNSIHHNNQRCVTCHGTMGCLIEDNFCYETHGHAYFLEDGVEAGTILTGNLGMSTRKGTVIPSDDDPATFWITHPNVTVNHNVAAGGDAKGFWFLQAEEPTGVSKIFQDRGLMHYFNPGEAFRMPLGDISHNKAHSYKFGYFFDNVLGPDQSVVFRRNLIPHEDISDPTSKEIESFIDDIICYKSKTSCIWMHLKNGRFSNFVTAESAEGYFSHEPSWITDSLFVGETANIGGLSERTYPNRQGHSFGLRFYVHPAIVANSVFDSFTDTADWKYRAIGLKKISKETVYHGAVNITYTDTPVGGRIYDHKPDRVRQFMFHDWTGDITETEGAVITRDFPHLVTDQCVDGNPEWGPLKVCQEKYISMKFLIETATSSLFKATDPSVEFAIEDDKHYFLRSAPGYDNAFIFNMGANVLKEAKGTKQKIHFMFRGLDSRADLIVGICLPLSADQVSIRGHPKFNSMTELEAATESSYFHDSDAGVLYLRLIGKDKGMARPPQTWDDIDSKGHKAAPSKGIFLTYDDADRDANCHNRPQFAQSP